VKGQHPSCIPTSLLEVSTFLRYLPGPGTLLFPAKFLPGCLSAHPVASSRGAIPSRQGTSDRVVVLRGLPGEPGLQDAGVNDGVLQGSGLPDLPETLERSSLIYSIIRFMGLFSPETGVIFRPER
jgi:hypothetical protein